MSNKLNVVDGVAFWASILTPNKSTETYNIDLSVDSDTAEHLKSLGMKAASKKDGSKVEHEKGKQVFRFKRKVLKKDGTATSPPVLVDAQKNPIKTLIGNGSTVKVAFRMYEWKFKGKEGVSADLSGVQILDLVEFAGSVTSAFDVEEGFTSSNAEKTSGESVEEVDF